MFVEAEDVECGVRTGVPSLSDTPHVLRFAGLAESSGSAASFSCDTPIETRHFTLPVATLHFPFVTLAQRSHRGC